MEEKSKLFLPIGTTQSENRIAELIESLKLYVGNNKTEDPQTLLNLANDRIEKYKKNYDAIVAYISQFFGKYVHMKFYYNINYSSSRESEPVWSCDYETNVYLYRYVPSNCCLFGIYNDLNNEYNGGVVDKSIDLRDKLEGHKLEINEITEEEFIKTANESIVKCMEYRLNKNKSDEYSLTKNGYVRL